jgi:methylmalonyl-CoA mutase C-terminal domain/subunit
VTRRLLRVVLALFGPENTEDTAITLGRLLRDDGVEVVYAGRLETAEQLVRTVEQEDPDILGVVRGAEGEPDGLGEALPDVRLFAVGDRPSRLENVFETAEEAAKWVSGVRAHTLEAPSDRVR